MYQHGKIENGVIELKNHTLEKYNFCRDTLLKFNIINSITDFGCAEGLIGLKIKQDFPSKSVNLFNISKNELKISEDNKNLTNLNVKLFNVSVQSIDKNVETINCIPDLSLFFAVVHHLLYQTKSQDETLNLLTKTNKYSIIEFPLFGDVLLDTWISRSSKELYSIMENLDSVKKFLSKKFDILEYRKIEYNKDLNRYAFLCKLK